MKIGFFTDTYFPQVSGVATSIKTLKQELEKHGHEVYIFRQPILMRTSWKKM